MGAVLRCWMLDEGDGCAGVMVMVVAGRRGLWVSGGAARTEGACEGWCGSGARGG